MPNLPPHLHPMVIHFPIALFLTALGLEYASWIWKKERLHHNAVILYVIASLLTPVVVQTGLWEAKKLGIHHPLLDQHRHFATWLMWFSISSLPILWLIKNKWIKYFRIVLLVFMIGTVTLVSLTADKGGDMVYEYGVGVE